MDETSPQEVLQFVERCLDALEEQSRSGVESPPLASFDLVDEMIEDNPALASAVRERLEWLARTGMLDEQGGIHPEGQREFPERLGDFRLVEPIGQGGMGVVFRAQQESLGRDVALKMIRPGEMFFPGSLDRFRREVDAMARLDHPAIVSIYMVGEADGVPYFAMERVQGLSLDQLLAHIDERRPERLSGVDLQTALSEDGKPGSSTAAIFSMGWVDACFRLMLQVGEALVHAHERGVLHRDIKPSNVMLTVSGDVRILDFGLAWAEGANPLTRSGLQLGSLPYMAPEQVRGDGAAIDARTDVYALAVTLYELLTLRAPFAADRAEQTRERVLAGRPVPLERLNSTVPWDAETVCLTAMDPDPDRRYPTMQAFVDDIGRFLARQPIQARRPGLWLRTRRWAQRSPRKAAGVALAGGLMVGGPATYGVLEHMARNEIHAAHESEVEQRLRAEHSLNDAIAAIDEMLRQGSDEEFAASPGTDPARRQLLSRALSLYETLLRREGDNPVLTGRVIYAQTRVARLQRELGNLQDSEQAARRALALCDEFENRRRAGGPAAQKVDLEALRLDALFALMGTLFIESQFDEYKLRYAEALEIPNSEHPQTAESQLINRLAASQSLARIEQHEGQLMKALGILAETAKTGEQLIEEYPEQASFMCEVGTVYQTIAYYEGFHHLDPEYDRKFERSVQLLERSLELDADNPGFRNRLSRALSNWVHADLREKDPQKRVERAKQAVPRAERAVEMTKRLCTQFPYREHYADSYLSNVQRLSWAYRVAGEDDSANEIMQTGIDFGMAALERHPEGDGCVFYLAMLQGELGRSMDRRKEFERADVLWEGARESWVYLLERPQPRLPHRKQAGVFYDNFARYMQSRGKLEAAEQAAQTGIDWHRRLLQLTGISINATRLGKTMPLLVRIQIERQKFDAAVSTLEEAVAGGYLGADGLAEFEPTLGARADFQSVLARARDQSSTEDEL